MAKRAAKNDIKDAEAQCRLLIETRLVSVDWRSCIAFDRPADVVAQQARCADAGLGATAPLPSRWPYQTAATPQRRLTTI